MSFHHGLHPGGGVSVVSIHILACMMLVQQVLPPDAGIAAQIERLGLTGALILAVGVLWRSLSKKDDQLTLITRQVTEALAFNTDTQKELRSIVEASTKAKQDLKSAIDELTQGIHQFPCQGPAEWSPQRRGGAGGGG